MPSPAPKGANVELMEVATAMPYLIPSVAEKFRKLREYVKEKSGHDFLAKAADMLRSRDFQSSKSGVANKSWHKTGRAFDYDQSSPLLVIVREDKAGKTYFRTYLRAADGLGIIAEKRDVRGYKVKDNLFDFTAAAERFGFSRIPAWGGWSVRGKGYNLMEFWHYEIRDGLTWDQAMAQTYAPVPASRPVLKRGDTGPNTHSAIMDLQRKLKLTADGKFGPRTEAAVIAFQQRSSLPTSGVVDEPTWKALDNL